MFIHCTKIQDNLVNVLLIFILWPIFFTQNLPTLMKFENNIRAIGRKLQVYDMTKLGSTNLKYKYKTAISE